MKTITTLTICGLTALGAATTAHAGSPTCADFNPDWDNHGTHVREDYVFNTEDGSAGGARGGPAHLQARPDGPAPGASFCLDQAQSPGKHPSDFGS